MRRIRPADAAASPKSRLKGSWFGGAAKTTAWIVLAPVLGILVLASPIILFWIWANFLAFGSLKIENRTQTAITAGELDTFFASRPIPPIEPGKSRRLFFWVGGENPWRIELQNAKGEIYYVPGVYYSIMLDPVVNDTVVITPSGVQLNGEPFGPQRP